jgi:hypothetical protein
VYHLLHTCHAYIRVRTKLWHQIVCYLTFNISVLFKNATVYDRTLIFKKVNINCHISVVISQKKKILCTVSECSYVDPLSCIFLTHNPQLQTHTLASSCSGTYKEGSEGCHETYTWAILFCYLQRKQGTYNNSADSTQYTALGQCFPLSGHLPHGTKLFTTGRPKNPDVDSRLILLIVLTHC